MKVPEPLSTAFGAPFEELISRFATDQKLLTEPSEIRSQRFLARSVVPHVKKLSSVFNRFESDASHGLAPYWKESSNPRNLRLAYFLYFMPSNLFRVSSIIAELSRLGFRWNASKTLKGLELGAGPAAGACGIAAGEKYAPIGIPSVGNWALIEQDKGMLELGSEWAAEYFRFVHPEADWGIRNFHRTIELEKGLLPKAAPQFNLWVCSYYLNESSLPPEKIAPLLIDAWEKHLEDEGLAIIVEPALKLQSRKLLAIRKALLAEAEVRGIDWLKILAPCLGHQACGALAAPDDWCHEDVSWWRPPYFKTIDQMAGLDRKSLPFSYLAITKSKRTHQELLPAIKSHRSTQRLVSPAHSEGKELEFFLCGEEGKRRARYRPKTEEEEEINRGDILINAEIRGDVNSSRVESLKSIL